MPQPNTLDSGRRSIGGFLIGLIVLCLMGSCAEQACVECDVSSVSQTGSETRAASSRWAKVVEDPDDPWLGDLSAAYMRTTSSALELRIELDALFNICQDDVDLYIFLDTDRNQVTGFNSSRSPDFAPNDMGADFVVMISGGYVEFDEWVEGLPYGWRGPSSEEITRMVWVNPRTVEVGVSLAAIGDPRAIDVVLICDPDFWPHVYDYAPDEDLGHITYTVRHLSRRTLTEP